MVFGKKIIYIIATLIFFSCQNKTTIRTPEVEQLLSQMTIEEKIGQLNLVRPKDGTFTGTKESINVEQNIQAGNIGGIFGIYTPEKLRKVQALAMKSRMGIPLLFGADVIHGYKTTFPTPLALSSSWNMEAIKLSAQIAAKEATADGLNWNFSPMVDISRDPRWGRVVEGAGEDPYLGSKIAIAMVEGYQGEDLSSPYTMMACVKHFALYGEPEAGKDYNSVDMSRVKMYNQFMAPYQAAIDAGVGSVMSSFNDVDGVPATVNNYLLTEVLRNQWGFDGFVVSDYTSLGEVVDHGLGDLQQVSALALHAGLDMDMVSEGFLSTLKQSLDEGLVSEEAITDACRRILEAKYKLGLFDDPYRYIDEARPAKDILTDENRAIARKIARETFVLLKNDTKALPVSKNARIALVGPLANSRSDMLGAWASTGDCRFPVTLLEGFKEVAPDAIINYAQGCFILDRDAIRKKVDIDAMIAEAVSAAKKSDVVIAAVGENKYMSGEAKSRTKLELQNDQKKLIKALVSTGKPVVLLTMSGRPIILNEEMDLPVSILQTWHAGVEAGRAIADVVFGDYNPSGKLTSTWVRSVGQIPLYHSVKNTGRPLSEDNPHAQYRAKYEDVVNDPLFPFGYGLSYTTFSYSNLSVDKKEIYDGDSVVVSVTVENTGDSDGEDVVQLYLRDVVRTITPPKRQLKGFKKIFFKKGESKSIQFTLLPEDLKFYNSNLNFVSEPGEFQVFVGGNSNTNLVNSFVLK